MATFQRGSFPYIVIRLMAAVYQRESVVVWPGEPACEVRSGGRSYLRHPWPLDSDSAIVPEARKLLIDATLRSVESTGFRMCVVWSPGSCSYCEKGGVVNESSEPPSGGLASVIVGGRLVPKGSTVLFDEPKLSPEQLARQQSRIDAMADNDAASATEAEREDEERDDDEDDEADVEGNRTLGRETLQARDEAGFIRRYGTRLPEDFDEEYSGCPVCYGKNPDLDIPPGHTCSHFVGRTTELLDETEYYREWGATIEQIALLLRSMDSIARAESPASADTVFDLFDRACDIGESNLGGVRYRQIRTYIEELVSAAPGSIGTTRYNDGLDRHCWAFDPGLVMKYVNAQAARDLEPLVAFARWVKSRTGKTPTARPL